MEIGQGEAARQAASGDWGLSAISAHLVPTLIYGCVGLLLFGIAFWIMCKVAPFSIRKEIEDDQNISLSVIMGAVIIGIAIIVAAAIAG